MDIVNAVHAHIQNHPINSGEQPNGSKFSFSLESTTGSSKICLNHFLSFVICANIVKLSW